MGRPGAVEGCATVSDKMCNKNGRRFCCFTPPSVPVRGCGSEGRQAVGGARAATGRRSLRSCADKMDDSEDEFRSRVPPGRRRRPRGIGTAAALAAGPPALPPGRGLKRGGAPSAARPAGGKRRRAAGGETLEAAARSRAEVGLGGKRPKAETRGCRRPPPLLLQRPEEARRGLEARAALLLSEAPAAPHTPPLPVSRWDGGPAASPAGWLWELSSLTTVTPRGADQRPEFRAPGAPAESPETERFSSRAGECFEGGRPRDADTLQDLVELAGEGLTFTQWSLDIGRPEPPEQEQMPGVQQKAFTRLLEKQQQQQQLFQNCSYEKFPLGSLAVAFKEMVNNPHLSDIQIQVDSGEVFYAHMFVLYARCPQLLQFVDHRCFVVAEEGEVRTSRVLLHDAPGDAVALFLKYLYTAEHFVPQHLLSDVVDLAIRFGVKELAVLCEGQSSEEISVEKPVDDKDKVGNFEELLKSMWQDEETAAKSVCRDEINDSMNEQELEEIYEFVATQRRMTSDEVRKEKVCTECRYDEVEKKISQIGGSCPRKALEKPRRAMTIKEGEIKCDLESSKLKTSNASMEKDLKKYSVEFQLDFKEIVSFGASTRKEPTSEIHLGLAVDSTHSNHLERSATQFSVSEMKCSLWKENINIANNETTTRNFPRLFQESAKDLQITLITSASQPNILDRLPSQNGKQENINRKGEAPIGSLEKSGVVNPHELNITSDHIVVLDSDEELEQEAEKKQAEAASSFSEQQSWHKVSAVANVNCWSPSPPQQDVGKVADRVDTLICNEVQSLDESHQPLNLSSYREGSFWEGLDRSEGRTLVVPETPLPAWNSLDDVQVEKSRLNSSLKKQWTHETQTKPLSCSYKPLPVLSSTSLLKVVKPNNGLCATERDVVVDDSEEEQEAVPPCSKGIFVESLEVRTPNARNPLKASVHMFDMQDNHPVNVASSVANSAATFHFGVGDLLLHKSQNWPGKDSDSNEALPACSSLSASIPVSKISVTDLACQARDISCVSPFMPLPPYSSMDTPELKKELSRFGVRALPKQQMVLKLKEIFQFTHQQARTDSKKKSMPVATSSFQKLEQKRLAPYRLLQGNPNTTNLTDLSEGGAQRPEAGLGWPKRAAFPAKRLADGEGNGDLILTTSQVSAGTTGTGNETYAAFQSSSVEFKISTLSEKEENVPASQIAASGEGQQLEFLKHYIHSNPSLCQQILLYQPIELSVLHAELKQNGIRISLDKLLDFLDANCITFTTAEARREKQHHLHRSKRKGQR
ncbi:structure-specific endonuclease subunit SLX4 isoform X2 [Crotalus tigris]|uniref:structure-specific endonuclease subunit SLX4 isoform X2 n=1 Tax=Crotalus tigris TaxID=88082 RepID=UPI00192F6BA7|nr:structure-specific endonuclease subunit SLX4 isoform X2 [Crotalus tigris]